MPTVINNPTTDSGSGAGALVTLIVVVALGILFFLYALPALRDNTGGTNINVPDRIQIDQNGGQ